MVDIRTLALPIRVTENKYVKSTLEDSVHFGSLEGYKNIESQGIGDEDEGKIVGLLKKGESKITIRSPESDKEITLTDKDFMQDPQMEYRLKDGVEKRIGVASFGLLTFRDFKLDRSFNNRKYFKLRKDTLDDIKRLIEDKEKLTGNKCNLIIFSNPDFFSSIKESGYEADIVQYYDPYNLSQFSKLKNGNKAYCYLKKDYFKYQREYRIIKIAKNKFPQEGENVKIKGISKRASFFSLDQLKTLQLIADFN